MFWNVPCVFFVTFLPFLLFHNVRNKIFRIATAIPKISVFFCKPIF